MLSLLPLQSNLAKQLAKLVKVKYVEDISTASRVGTPLTNHPLNTHFPIKGSVVLS